MRCVQPRRSHSGRNSPASAGAVDRLSANSPFSPLRVIAGCSESIPASACRPAKRTMVEGRLRQRVRALGLAGLDEYAAYLFEQAASSTRSSSTSSTASPPTRPTSSASRSIFDFLREHAAAGAPGPARAPAPAPQGLERRLLDRRGGLYARHGAGRACRRHGRGFAFPILGTDICTEVLRTAVPASIREDDGAGRAAGSAPALLCCARSQRRARQVRIVPELRRMVRFARLNLMDARTIRSTGTSTSSSAATS